jgi:acetyl-CoA carboxylase biotin carboxyl carrier protein
MNLKELKEMIGLMNENGLSEIEIEKDNVKVKLKKQTSGMVTHEIRPMPVTSGSISGHTPAKEEVKPPSEPAAAANEFVVRSPMVGTFYSAQTPEAEPFVSVGKTVKDDDTLCIIEAMKLMNEIKAEVTGTVTAILVKNGHAVEYDQPLFHIKRS